jgi:hypothetical protein
VTGQAGEALAVRGGQRLLAGAPGAPLLVGEEGGSHEDPAGAERPVVPLVGADGAALALGPGLRHEHDGQASQLVVDHGLLGQAVEGVGLGGAVHEEGVDPGLLGKKRAPPEDRERVLRGLGLGVVDRMSGLEGEHPGVGMGPLPGLPGGDDHRQALELDARAREGAVDRLARHLAPQRVRLAVDQEVVAFVEEAGGGEGELAPGGVGPVEDARAATGAPGQGDRHPADLVVGHRVPVQDAQRVGPGVAVDLDAEDRLVRGHVSRHPGTHQRGVVQGRAGLGVSPLDLLDGDLRPAAAVEEALVRSCRGVGAGRGAGKKAQDGGDGEDGAHARHPIAPF